MLLTSVCRTAEVSHKKKQAEKKQTGSKILVRNIPFQATVREIRELFWYHSKNPHHLIYLLCLSCLEVLTKIISLIFSVHLGSLRLCVFQRKQLVQGIIGALPLLISSPNRMLRFVCYNIYSSMQHLRTDILI